MSAKMFLFKPNGLLNKAEAKKKWFELDGNEEEVSADVN